MKFRLLSILVICLMISTVTLATTTWNPSAGELYWSEATAWTGTPAGIVPDDTTQVKVSVAGKNVILNDFQALVAQKLTIGGTGALAAGPVMTIVDGGTMVTNRETQIGDSAGKSGQVIQTGGTFSASIGTSSGTVFVGYKSTGVGEGAYTISGGTITGTSQWRVGVSTTGVPGAKGTLTVKGDASSITVGSLVVAQEDNILLPTPVTGFTGNGTLAFEIQSGAVSAINTGSVTIDKLDNEAAIANLVVTLTSGTQAAVTLLVNNTGAAAVDGAFDNITLGAGLVGSVVYTYNADTAELTGGNDIALIIPEPATIALLSLGLFVIRRKK